MAKTVYIIGRHVCDGQKIIDLFQLYWFLLFSVSNCDCIIVSVGIKTHKINRLSHPTHCQARFYFSKHDGINCQKSWTNVTYLTAILTLNLKIKGAYYYSCNH